jgi:hypothetical protein
MSFHNLEPSPNPSEKIIQIIFAVATLLDSIYHLLSFLFQFFEVILKCKI